MAYFVGHNFTHGSISMITIVSPSFGISLCLGLRLTPPSVTVRTAVPVPISHRVVRGGSRLAYLLFHRLALLGIRDFVLSAAHFFIGSMTLFVWYLGTQRDN